MLRQAFSRWELSAPVVRGGLLSRRVVGVTLDNLDLLPKKCRRCVFWELAPHIREQAEEFGQTELEKESWVSSVLLEWGSCGRIVMSGDVPAGYVLYAPPAAVPRASAFPTSPVSADAVLLTALKVLPEFGGGGLGRMLVQSVAKDLTRRGVKAIEAFGDAKPTHDSTCVVPAEFLQQVGFKTVHAHPRWPRLRLELRTALTWKEDVEAALERLLGSVTIHTAEPILRPA
jgi:predicted N-acetyltransferase YhbS